MKATELMIGDLFDVHRSECVADGGHFQEWQEYGKIVGITEDYVTVKYTDREEDYGFEDVDHSDLKPIPLTPEILEKNGFSKQWNDCWKLKNSDLMIDDDNGLYIGISMLSVRIDYVHELQHALRLCGIGKEVEL